MHPAIERPADRCLLESAFAHLRHFLLFPFLKLIPQAFCIPYHARRGQLVGRIRKAALHCAHRAFIHEFFFGHGDLSIG